MPLTYEAPSSRGAWTLDLEDGDGPIVTSALGRAMDEPCDQVTSMRAFKMGAVFERWWQHVATAFSKRGGVNGLNWNMVLVACVKGWCLNFSVAEAVFLFGAVTSVFCSCNKIQNAVPSA